MEIDDLFGDYVGIPAKLMETKCFVRMGTTGTIQQRLQIIRVEPMVTDEGQLVPQNVLLFIDEGSPTIMDRMAAEQMLSTSNCEPLERMLNWRHKIRH